MKTIEINGYTAQNFGTSNYSHGMEAIIFRPQDISVEQVKTLPDVYLHPTVEPNELEIFAIRGSKEQFEKFYRSAVETHCTRIAIDKLGGLPEYDNREAWDQIQDHKVALVNSFKPWYNL